MMFGRYPSGRSGVLRTEPNLRLSQRFARLPLTLEQPATHERRYL
jgi:hypothetical protein